MIPINAGNAIDLFGDAFDLVGANQDQKAMADQLANEIRIQGAYTQAGNQAWAQQLPTLGRESADEQVGKGASERTQGYESLYDTPLSTQPMVGQPRDLAHARVMGQMRAKLGGYGDWMHNQGIQQEELSNKLGQIGFQSEGWAKNVYPYQMAAAQHVGDIWNTIGTGIKMVGSVFGGQAPSMDSAQNPSAFASPSYSDVYNWYLSGGGPNYQMPSPNEPQNQLGGS